MSNVKISALPDATQLDGSEDVPIVQNSETVKTTAQDIANLAPAGGVTGSNMDVQFNDTGTLGSSFTFQFNKTTGRLILRQYSPGVIMNGFEFGGTTLGLPCGRLSHFDNNVYLDAVNPDGKIRFRTDNGFAPLMGISKGALGIGTPNPDYTAVCLHLNSGGTRALALPQMTKAERDAMDLTNWTGVGRLMIYQTDNTPGLRVYNGTNWMRFTETID